MAAFPDYERMTGKHSVTPFREVGRRAVQNGQRSSYIGIFTVSMRSQPNEIRVVLFDVRAVLAELSGLAMLLSWLGHRLTAEQVCTLWLNSPTVRSFETGKMQGRGFC